MDWQVLGAVLMQSPPAKIPAVAGIFVKSSALPSLRRRRRLAGHDEPAVARADADASVRRKPGTLQPVPAQSDVRHVPIACVVAAAQGGIVRGADGDAPLGG